MMLHGLSLQLPCQVEGNLTQAKFPLLQDLGWAEESHTQRKGCFETLQYGFSLSINHRNLETFALFSFFEEKRIRSPKSMWVLFIRMLLLSGGRAHFWSL